MLMQRVFFLVVLGSALAAALAGNGLVHAADAKKPDDPTAAEWSLPNERLKMSFKDEIPMVFVNRGQNAKAWDALPAYFNDAEETAVDPKTGQAVTRRIVKVKVPLGLTQNPPIPAENLMTLQKWALGKKLYFDTLLSSDGTVSCASCHAPSKGYTDQSPVSTGIKSLKGGMSAPTVINSAYNAFQFWDGRAASLEDQAQGPVQNAVEMFDGDGHAWNHAIRRIRQKPDYAGKFEAVFGHQATRDAVAKAIATYERTVLNGNSIHDRAELAMRKRVEGDDDAKPVLLPVDYETALKDALARKDQTALKALGLDLSKDADRVGGIARCINQGRELFSGKARCNACHVGINFTDNAFHNLGVGVKDGVLPKDVLGRFAAVPTGHKNPEQTGAFKTPGLRGLMGTGPYLHDGSEKTLEAVVDFYDRGGNANEFLDIRMRDYEAEKAFELARINKTEYKGPEVKVFGDGQKPIAPLKLNLTADEKAALVLFMKALDGDPIDPVVADKTVMPK
jgi:cytochrome c peroxidase